MLAVSSLFKQLNLGYLNKLCLNDIISKQTVVGELLSEITAKSNMEYNDIYM